jgi:peptidoglycan/xylan/chitin deacetylase (PgdA/CDA1 family)
MYPIKIPKFIQHFFANYTFSIPKPENVIYLTFDDGPIPEITPWVLEQLAIYDAKATFFMIGDNIRKYPEIYQQVIDGNHAVGNHTFNHLNGWKTDNETYFENVQKCAETIDTKLFRPPYGKLKPSQAKYLRKQYKIILWEILSGDFDKNISSERCLENVLNNTKNGSIIVFHDSLKAEKHLRFVLPKTLAYFHEKGFTFQLIKNNQK